MERGATTQQVSNLLKVTALGNVSLLNSDNPCNPWIPARTEHRSDPARTACRELPHWADTRAKSSSPSTHIIKCKEHPALLFVSWVCIYSVTCRAWFEYMQAGNFLGVGWQSPSVLMMFLQDKKCWGHSSVGQVAVAQVWGPEFRYPGHT